MACRYNYKGYEFDSELALDDFLIERKKYESVLGDIVFHQTTTKSETQKLLVELEKESKELDKIYQEVKRQNELIYAQEGGDASFVKLPYIGVNKYLSGLTIDGDLLFPEFREESYWTGQYSRWKRGRVSDEQLEVFGYD